MTTGRVGCGPTTRRRILIAQEANGPQTGRRDGCIAERYRGQITGGGHVVLALDRRRFYAYRSVALALIVADAIPDQVVCIG